MGLALLRHEEHGKGKQMSVVHCVVNRFQEPTLMVPISSTFDPRFISLSTEGNLL